MEANEISSKRGKSKFFHHGHQYVFDKNSACGTMQFWRCDQKGTCKARIHTNQGALVKSINEHNHDSAAAKIEAAVVRTRMKRKAEVTMEPTSHVINSCINELSQSGQVALASHSALKKMIRRKRKEISAAPPMPASIEELLIPEAYTSYKNARGEEDRFLLADNAPSPNRILIFDRHDNLKILKESKHWYIDGTFRSAPQLFSQVYVILAEKFGGVHPIVYVLLQNKQSATYQTMLNMLKQLQADLNPERISCDFELAAIKAFQNAFPNTEMQGCFFHLTKNLKKHLCENDLIREYNNNGDFALSARMITSLAFVPIEDLDNAIDELADEIPQALQPILQWFEDFYVGRPNRRGGRRPAIFPPNTWSVYRRVIENQYRTNNHAEAAHRRLQCELAMDHPLIWKFIDGLRVIQHGRDKYMEELIAGRQPAKKLKKYIMADERIRRIVEEYNNRGIRDYLRGLSHNYEMEP